MIRKVYCSFSLDLKLVSYSGFPIYVSFFTKNVVRINFKILLKQRYILGECIRQLNIYAFYHVLCNCECSQSRKLRIANLGFYKTCP